MRMLVEIIKDLRSFFVVVVFLMLGFNLIFYQYAPEEYTFGDQLLITYVIMYSQFDTSNFTPEQTFFFVIITVLLSVILLNMIIAVMTDTFDRVQQRRSLFGSKEKLTLILESTLMKRTLLRVVCPARMEKRDKAQSKYLFVAEEGQAELFEAKDHPWEEPLKKLKDQVAKNAEAQARIESSQRNFEEELIQHKRIVSKVHEDFANRFQNIENLLERIAENQEQSRKLPFKVTNLIETSPLFTDRYIHSAQSFSSSKKMFVYVQEKSHGDHENQGGSSRGVYAARR